MTNLSNVQKFMQRQVKTDLPGGDRRRLEKALTTLGEENVGRLLDEKVTLSQPNEYVTEVASRRAAYTPGNKNLNIAASRFDRPTVLHEFGHALDDAAEPDRDGQPVLKSEVDPKLQGLYQEYLGRCQETGWWDKLWGRTQWSEYATTNPQEYLAEGVRLFTTSDRSHRQLSKNDPALEAYLAEFLKMPSLLQTNASTSTILR